MKTLAINEIFTSIDGEVNEWGQGILTTFIRLQGCNLRCSYCDTEQAQEVTEGCDINDVTIEELVYRAQMMGCPKITITGGEPLMQDNTMDLIHELISKGFLVSVETNGTYNMPNWSCHTGKLNYIVDYKLFLEGHQMIDLSKLPKGHWIKFIIDGDKHSDKFHNNFAKALKVKRQLRERGCKARMAFSATTNHEGVIQHLMEEEEWDITVNVQIHKLIKVR